MTRKAASYRDSYRTLPGTEALEHVRMSNASRDLDYVKACEHIESNAPYLKAHASRMMARARKHSAS
jgi:hypothetical protein